MTTLQIVQIAIILVYFAILIIMGKFAATQVKSNTDFHLAGRQMSWFVIAAGVVGTAFSGAMITSITSVAYTYGMGGIWLEGFALLAFFIMGAIYVKRVRLSGAFTISEFLEVRYDYRTRAIAGVFLILGGLNASAAQFAAIGTICETMWGIDRNVGIIAAWIVLVIYMFLGGFAASNITHIPQLIFCVITMPGLAIWAWIKFGGTQALTTATELPAGVGAEWFSVTNIPLALFLTWFLQWTWVNGWNSQHYFQRAAAGRDVRHSKIGFYFTGVCLVFIILIPGLLIGMFARHVNPSLDNPEAALSMMMMMAPVGLGIIAAVGIFAAAMSTIDACSFGAVTIFTRDFYERRAKNATSAQVTRVSRITTVIVLVVVLLMATSLKSALTGLSYIFIFSTAIFGALVAALFWKKACKEAAVISIVVAGAVSVIWTALGGTARLNGAWWAVFLSMTLMVVISLIVEKTGPWWGKDKQAKADSKTQEIILDFLKNRKATMADLADRTEIGSADLNIQVIDLVHKGKVKEVDYMTYTLIENAGEHREFLGDGRPVRDFAMILSAVAAIVLFAVMWNITA